MRDRFPHTIGRFLGCTEDFGHSLIRGSCIEPSPRRYQLSQIQLVSAWQRSLVQVVSEYPGYLSPLGPILLLNGRTAATQQRVDEVCGGIQGVVLCGICRGSTLLSTRKRRR